MNKQKTKAATATVSEVAPVPHISRKQMKQFIQAFGENDLYYETSIQMRIDSDFKNKVLPDFTTVEATLYQFAEDSDRLESITFPMEDILKIDAAIQDVKRKAFQLCPTVLQIQL